MPILAVWAFSTPDGAEHAVRGLSRQAARAQLALHDAAIVLWPEDAAAPSALRVRHPRIGGTAGRGFWVLLLGALFGSPAGQSLRRRLGEETVTAVRCRMTAGGSTLLVLCRADSPVSLDLFERGLPGQPSRLCALELRRPVREAPTVDLTAVEDRVRPVRED